MSATACQPHNGQAYLAATRTALSPRRDLLTVLADAAEVTKFRSALRRLRHRTEHTMPINWPAVYDEALTSSSNTCASTLRTRPATKRPRLAGLARSLRLRGLRPNTSKSCPTARPSSPGCAATAQAPHDALQPHRCRARRSRLLTKPAFEGVIEDGKVYGARRGRYEGLRHHAPADHAAAQARGRPAQARPRLLRRAR